MIRNTFGSKQLQADACIAGDKAYAKLVAGRSNRYLLITFAAVLTISSAVSAILGLGSAVQLWDYVTFDHNGTEVQIDPRHLLSVSDYLSQSSRTSTRVTSLSASPVTLKEQIVLPFEYLAGGNPGETRFRENDIKLSLRLGYQLNGTNNGLAKLVTGGTATITSPVVTVQQYFDDDKTMRPPLFRPWWKTITYPVLQSQSEALIPIDFGQDLLRGITILQNTGNKGMVNDIITQIGFRGADGFYIGQGQMLTLDEYVRGLEFRSGGNPYAGGNSGGVFHINEQEVGRLSHLVNPSQDSNFQLALNVAPSQVSGATGSEVRILLHLLQRKAVQRDDGLWITAPDSMMPTQLVA